MGSSQDGAHQAILLQQGSRKPVINDECCVGCNLCSLVCPVDGCISMQVRNPGEAARSHNDYLADGQEPVGNYPRHSAHMP